MEFVENRTISYQMNSHQPPKLARKIFEWYCGQAKVEDLLGDLDEWFHFLDYINHFFS